MVLNDTLVPLACVLCQQLEGRSQHIIARMLNRFIQRHTQIFENITSIFAT